MSRFTAIGIVLIFVLSFVLINAGARGTYRAVVGGHYGAAQSHADAELRR
jgi:hypothetical protein